MSDVKRGRGNGALAATIDTLLFEGGRRLCDVTKVILENHPDRYTKGQVVNNVRARITYLTTRGYTLERDAANTRLVRLVKVPVSPAVV